MYAVIETGGKQYQVKEGDEIYIERLPDTGTQIQFDKVLLISGDAETTLGKPYVLGASVKAELIKNGKAKKVVVFTYKSKKSEKRKKGHRQPYSKVKILGINQS